jgi:hypothetical protein
MQKSNYEWLGEFREVTTCVAIAEKEDFTRAAIKLGTSQVGAKQINEPEIPLNLVGPETAPVSRLHPPVICRTCRHQHRRAKEHRAHSEMSADKATQQWTPHMPHVLRGD